MPPMISPDGRWWWDGSQWRSRIVEGELSLFWFTTTPDWASRILLMGLIGLIPIVGTITMYGWTLVATDMIRSGWRELPPAGFRYLERGVPPFVTALIYEVVVAFAVGGVAIAAIAVGLSGSSLVPVALALGLLDLLFLLAVVALGLYMFAALLIGSDRLGIARALNPLGLFGLAGANQQASLRVGVTYFVAVGGISLALAVVSFVLPFAGLVASVALPGVFALVVPALATFRVEPAP